MTAVEKYAPAHGAETSTTFPEELSEAATETLDWVEKALTQPEVLNDPSSFADKIAEFKVDFNILESIQQTMLKGRELSVGGTERDREAARTFPNHIFLNSKCVDVSWRLSLIQ